MAKVPCSFAVGDADDDSQKGTNELTEGELSYTQYLMLDRVLSSQNCLSDVHDEHLFIVTHQTYELWFKQVLVEIDSIRDVFKAPYLDEGNTLKIISRLHRIQLILQLLADQFQILETMTPLDFLDFRGKLGPSSGFQSKQFRMLENKMGVKQENRVKYNQKHYQEVFRCPYEYQQIEESINEPSLFQLVEKWLERTPGLETSEFNFWVKYEEAVGHWLENAFLKPAQNETDPEKRKAKMAEYKNQRMTFDSVIKEAEYNISVKRGERRLSHKAFQGALMICLYREQPRFHQPFQLITKLMDIDSQFTKWRYNHVLLVQRMIGSKAGTGGSSGYQYLRSTVSDRYKVFVDLFNMSTYQIPRVYHPPLTSTMRRRLSVLENIVDNYLSKMDLGAFNDDSAGRLDRDSVSEESDGHVEKGALELSCSPSSV